MANKAFDSPMTVAYGRCGRLHAAELWPRTAGDHGSVADTLRLFCARFSRRAVTLAPNTGQIFFLRIDATATGARLGQLQFNSNDPANPVLRIGLSAVASLLATGTVVLRLDDGTFERQAGFPGGDGFFLSRLKPSAYPATLKAIRIYFGERSLEPGEGFGLLWAAHRSSGVCRVRG
jgi:hypothetical protein